MKKNKELYAAETNNSNLSAIKNYQAVISDCLVSANVTEENLFQSEEQDVKGSAQTDNVQVGCQQIKSIIHYE